MKEAVTCGELRQDETVCARSMVFIRAVVIPSGIISQVDRKNKINPYAYCTNTKTHMGQNQEV